MKQSILLVGAGAVGQVYAWHFFRAGHDVHFFLKEKHVAEAQRGFTLYDLNDDKKRTNPVLFTEFGCQSDWAAVAEKRWDQVWLCMSSAALAQTDLQPMAQAIGEATVVVLQPGPDDLRKVQAVVGEERAVAGMITFMSYHAPLSGETVPRPGIAFWIPPLTPMAVDGERVRAEAVIATLNGAKVRAALRPGFHTRSVHSTGFFMAFLAALELGDWRFRTLGKNKVLLQTLKSAQREIHAAVAGHYGVKAPCALQALPVGLVPGALRLARNVTPVDLEVFFEAHFSKVRAQTVALLTLYAGQAEAQGLKHEAIDSLLAGLAAR